MFRLTLCALAITLLACACSGVDESTGHVTAITLDPSAPAAGEKTRIYVELFDPYIYNGLDMENPNPRVTLQVTGGTVDGQDRSSTSEGWEAQEGTSIIVYPHAAMYWTLPEMPGTYKLTVGFDGNTKTKRVEIH
jgi:hypothetical protein